jgi:hypothetical protein
MRTSISALPLLVILALPSAAQLAPATRPVKAQLAVPPARSAPVPTPLPGAVAAARPAAGTPTGAPPRAKGEAQIIQEILDQLDSADPAVRKTAIDAIRQRIQTRGITEIRSVFLRRMVAAKMHKEVADLAEEAILATPWETRSVEQVLQMRIRALIALGQGEQALSEAKSLFNIASMAGTSDAILMVAECLNAARPKEIDLFNRFREEQIAGAGSLAPTTRPAAQPPAAVRCTVLDGIKIDAKKYDDALAKMPGEDAQSLMARGNLLLLADRAREAKPIFERMYSLSGAEIVEASEALARQMKAEDGTIGRANAWVLSIRPKAKP